MENIGERSEFTRNVMFFLRQASGRKTATFSFDRTQQLFTRYLDDSILQEDVSFLSFNKPKYNKVLNKTFNKFNADNTTTKKNIQERIDSMVDDYIAKDIGINSTSSLSQIVIEIIQRRANLHDNLFSIFFTRILNDRIRQIVWRATLVIVIRKE